MEALFFSHAARQLLCPNCLGSFWPCEQPLEKIVREVPQRLGFVFGIGVYVVNGIVAIQCSDVGKFDNILFEYLHLTHRLNTRAKRIGRVPVLQPRIVAINFLRRNVDCLPERRSGCVICAQRQAFLALKINIFYSLANVFRWTGNGRDVDDRLERRFIKSRQAGIGVARRRVMYILGWSAGKNRDKSTICAYGRYFNSPTPKRVSENSQLHTANRTSQTVCHNKRHCPSRPRSFSSQSNLAAILSLRKVA